MLRSGAPRWLLPASLSMNVFLAVTIAVHLHSLESRRPPPPPRPERMVEDIAATLSPADATILRQAFASRAAQMERGFHAKHAVHDDVRAALTAPSFDPAALHAAFAEGRAGRDAMDQALEDGLTEAAGRMSPEGRRKLGEWAPPGPPPPR